MRGGLPGRLFSTESPFLPVIPKAQLVFLAGLAVQAFVLPLSGSQRWVVVAAGVLAGLTGPPRSPEAEKMRAVAPSQVPFERLEGCDAKPD